MDKVKQSDRQRRYHMNLQNARKRVPELEGRVAELEAQNAELKVRVDKLELDAEFLDFGRDLIEATPATVKTPAFSIACLFSDDDARDLEFFRQKHGCAFAKISDERLVLEYVREQLELERRRAGAAVKAIHRAQGDD
ncbi:hypothetical protein LG047_07750 [Methylocystis sp. WRRC1]|uniref:hypothetical protein n=1 Tax=Methylocystis sp. WRRC1 TaxID=1732014 RepID=UPI001D14280B|nr:hypothetical protein [Methylocystis sp. WRRC1]MCC3245213.1 hypothetical protein [Methylocystis sp. WRRC1]